MRISRSDQRALVIVDFPYLIAAFTIAVAGFMIFVVAKAPADRVAWLVAPLIAVCFLAFGAWLTKRSVFRFDLVARELRWTRRGLFGSVGGVVQFEQIHSAAVQSDWSSDSGRAYRVALQTDCGEIPLTETYAGGGDESAKRICTAINEALKVGCPLSVADATAWTDDAASHNPPMQRTGGKGTL